jgi:hypothetical protein
MWSRWQQSRGPVTLYPALKVEPQATVTDFDSKYPEGAGYVIVPAMSRDDDPAALRWIKSQAAKRAIVMFERNNARAWS